MTTCNDRYLIPVIDAPIDDESDPNAYLFASLTDEEIQAAIDEKPVPKAKKPASPRKPYAPGTAKGIKKIAPGVYEVLSFREEGKAYRVDLRNGTCSCPHSQKNSGMTCKHQIQAWSEVARETFLQALSQPLAKIQAAIERTTRPEVRNALISAFLRKQDRFAPEP